MFLDQYSTEHQPHYCSFSDSLADFALSESYRDEFHNKTELVQNLTDSTLTYLFICLIFQVHVSKRWAARYRTPTESCSRPPFHLHAQHFEGPRLRSPWGRDCHLPQS